MHVYTQAQNDWAIKKLIEQKMYSKSKRYRQSMRKNNIQRSQENTAVVHTNSIPDGDTDHERRDFVEAQKTNLTENIHLKSKKLMMMMILYVKKLSQP